MQTEMVSITAPPNMIMQRHIQQEAEVEETVKSFTKSNRYSKSRLCLHWTEPHFSWLMAAECVWNVSSDHLCLDFTSLPNVQIIM